MVFFQNHTASQLDYGEEDADLGDHVVNQCSDLQGTITHIWEVQSLCVREVHCCSQNSVRSCQVRAAAHSFSISKNHSFNKSSEILFPISEVDWFSMDTCTKTTPKKDKSKLMWLLMCSLPMFSNTYRKGEWGGDGYVIDSVDVCTWLCACLLSSNVRIRCISSTVLCLDSFNKVSQWHEN